MEVVEGRLKGWCYVLRMSVCQIVGNIKNVRNVGKQSHAIL